MRLFYNHKFPDIDMMTFLKPISKWVQEWATAWKSNLNFYVAIDKLDLKCQIEISPYRNE